MAKDSDFSGIWHSNQHFYNVFLKKIVPNEYDMRIHRTGNQLVAQSLPKEDESYFLLRLTIDGRILTGTFYEQSSPKKEFKGKGYYGTLQLLIDENNAIMRGKWVGLDTHMNMQSGDIEVVRESNY